jgi:hypothetical protein
MMNMNIDLPSLEARLRAQERMVTIFNARIEELSQDMMNSFRQSTEYQIQTEQKIDDRFEKIEARLDKIEANMASKEDMAAMEARVKEDMAAMEVHIKEDMAAMETRILDAFKQVLTMIDARLPSPR